MSVHTTRAIAWETWLHRFSDNWKKGKAIFMKLLPALGTVGLMGFMMAPPAKGGVPLERELVRQGPKIIKYLKDKGYANVGVLKFLVARDDGKESDNVGTLNLLLAQRLEVALILANDPVKPVGIIENATSVAHRTRGANHLSEEGRVLLFNGRFPLAWGQQEVAADAFVTGAARISKDLRRLTIRLQCFDKKSKEPALIGAEFQVDNQAELLGEMGESFVLRGSKVKISSRDSYQPDWAFQAAAQVKGEEAKHPISDKEAPVTLDVFYDNKRVPVKLRQGKAMVAEPKEKQKIRIVLKRDDSNERYGVVLKVNGENTIDKERLPDFHCRRWIMDPGDPHMTLTGYQMGDNTVEKFRVLSVRESGEREFSYGPDVGTITVTVFRELRGKDKSQDLSYETMDTAAVSQARLPAEKSVNSDALKWQIREDANQDVSRGLIAEGEKGKSKVRQVTFKPDPIPIMSSTVVYYKR